MCLTSSAMTSKTVGGGSLVDLLRNKVQNALDNLPYSNDESKVPVFADSLQELAACVYLSLFNKDLMDISDSAVQQLCSAIFSFKTKLYDAFLSSHDDPDLTEDYNSNLMKFFKELQILIQKEDNIYEKITGKEAGAELMKRIMCEILKRNRLDLEPLKVLALLCAISGLDIPLLLTTDSCCNNIFKESHNSSPINVVALNGLFEACSLYPQYFVISSSDQEYLKPSDWLEGIMAAFLDFNWTEDKKTWLKCIRSLLKISVPLVENNITKILNVCLFSFNMGSTDSKQEYCGLFTDLISLHSRLHQLPKFFVKILRSLTECIKDNSAGELLIKGYIFPSILESMAIHLQELHFGQTIELWSIFSEIYTTFVNMSKIFPSGKGIVLILSHIFATFLLHSKIFEPSLPSDIHEKYGNLIQLTIKELEKNVSILFDDNQALLQRSFLLLCSVVGKVKLSYTYHTEEKPFTNDLLWRSPEHPFDFSILFDFFTERHAKLFERFLNSEDKVLSLQVFHLQIIKIERLVHKAQLSDIELNQLKISISTVVQHAEENILNGAFWDLDLNTLSIANYGSAVWRTLLKFLPLILNIMNEKELLKICGCFREIILHDHSLLDYVNCQEIYLRSIVLLSLQSTHFQQSKLFQRSLISSIWKLDSLLLARKRMSVEVEVEETLIKILSKLSCFRRKWMKYAESTPKSNESNELNPLWSETKEICSDLNEILQSKSIIRTKIKAKVYNILELIDCIPLRYLQPGNQIRCVVGLSTLFFLIPESCRSDKALKIANKIAEQLIAIFDGERSIWLFDFVTSGPYLRETVNTIENLIKDNNDEIPHSLRLLLERVISLIAKSPKILSEAKDYLSELVQEEKFTAVTILMFSLMLQKLAQIFCKTDLKPEYASACEELASSVCSCCVKALKKCDAQGDHSTYLSLIQCYTVIIEILTLPSCPIGQKKRDKYFAQLPKIIANFNDECARNFSESSVILNLLICLCKFNQHISSLLPNGFHSTVWNSVSNQFHQRCSINAPDLHEIQVLQSISLRENEKELLKCLLPLLPSEELDNAFHHLCAQMKNKNISEDNVLTWQMNLNIIKEIIDCDSQMETQFLPKELIISFVSQLTYSSNLADVSDFHLKMVKLPVLHFINSLIKQQKGCLSDDQWLDCLYPCAVLNFDELYTNLQNFVEAFDAVWNCVYNLLVYRSGFILKTLSVFMMIVTNLLKSLVLAGSQDAMHAVDNHIRDRMILCSQNMERLFSIIPNHRIHFAKLVPFLIGDYADSVQHVTLESNIKNHLIAGLNHLLSLCSEDTLKMVAVCINQSCREIFSNIVKDYNQSRYRGYI